MGIKLGAEAALIDDKVISSYLHFINLAAELQLKIVDYPEVPVYHAGMDGALAAKAKPLFVNYPEWYVQDIADFLLFAVQHLPETVKNCIDDRVNTWLLTFIRSAHWINNPNLVVKLLQLLVSMLGNPFFQVSSQPYQMLTDLQATKN